MKDDGPEILFPGSEPKTGWATEQSECQLSATGMVRPATVRDVARTAPTNRPV